MLSDPFVTHLQDALGAKLPIQRELGGGGMSRVFVARDTTLERDVVVKVLAPELAQELSVERFAREIALAAGLQHANIVPLLTAGATSDGVPYYLMPFVDGESLEGVLESRGALPIAEVQLVLRDVVRALAVAHARGVVHRDIKPGNVMLSGGAAVVTDFGIAKAMSSAREESGSTDGDSSLTRMGTSIGTPNYMAPEQGAGDPDTDHRADIYALGAMTYELLTGSPPFGNRPAHTQLVAHLSEAPVHVSEHRPETPAALADLVMACLAKDPDDRPQTAQEVLDRLSAPGGTTAATVAGQAATPTAVGSTAGATAGVGGSKGRGIMYTALGVVLVAGALFGYSKLRKAPLNPDGTLLAVMPFTVRDASLQVWREGLVDVLSRSLDGAGNLRISSPSSSIAASPERADASTAAALASTLGAGLVLYGDLGTIGPDSVHLRAALYDAGMQGMRRDFDVRGEATRLDALADSLAIRVLRELSASGTLAGGKLSSMGTASLPALKAFVTGQRLYRAGRADSARAAFEEAVAADTTFSLAWRGLAATYIRMGRENEPQAQQALAQAIRFKAGRSPRDSMLLHADSLRLSVLPSLNTPNGALGEFESIGPLLTTLREATRRYPDDAELWLELGDASFHFGEFAVPADTSAAASFARAVQLDSTLLVPYFHGNALAMRTGNRDRVRRYTQRMGTLQTEAVRPYYELIGELLDSAPEISSRADSMLSVLPAGQVAGAMQQLAIMIDSLQVIDAVVARQLERPSPTANPTEVDGLNSTVAYVLAVRGRMRESASVETALPLGFRAQLSSMGAIPEQEIVDDARRQVRRDPASVVALVPFLSRMRDSVLLREIADSLSARAAAGVPGTTPGQLSIAEAGWLLARGDSAAALEALLEPSLLACSGTPCSGYQLAELLVAAGRDRDAARTLDRWLPSAFPAALYPTGALLRGQIAERLDDRARAIRMYEQVVARWGRGDDSVRETVDEAREGLQRLGVAS